MQVGIRPFHSGIVVGQFSVLQAFDSGSGLHPILPTSKLTWASNQGWNIVTRGAIVVDRRGIWSHFCIAILRNVIRRSGIYRELFRFR